jgi:hypothetical protein
MIKLPFVLLRQVLLRAPLWHSKAASADRHLRITGITRMSASAHRHEGSVI